jgi:hypothetical protein
MKYTVAGSVKTWSQFGPTIVMNVRNSATFNDWTEHAAFGNLRGVYGYGTNTYGVAFGKYQTGAGSTYTTIDATNGYRIFNGSTVIGQWDQSAVLTLGATGGSNPNLTLDGTNGIRIRLGTATVIGQWDISGNILVGPSTSANVYITSTGTLQIRTASTNKITLDNAGNLSLVGTLTVGTLGAIAMGATSYTVGNGLWADYNAGSPRFRVGNPVGTGGGSWLAWTGTVLSIGGDGSGLTAINGGAITTNTILTDSIKIGGPSRKLNNFSKSGTTTGWFGTGGGYTPTLATGVGGATPTFPYVVDATGANIAATTMVIVSASQNQIVSSDYMEVDPNETYEVRYRTYHQGSNAGLFYAGPQFYDLAKGTALSGNQFVQGTRTWGAATTGAYFQNAETGFALNTWIDRVGYIVGYDADISTLPGTGGIVRMPANTAYVRIRFLNYTAVAAVTSQLDIYSPTIQTLTVMRVHGNAVVTGTLDADRINAIDLSAVRANTGTLNVTGVLTVASGGGIFQGTGTFASPTTGLKIWSEGSPLIGRIAGYGGGAIQWYAGTDGKLYAGAGVTVLDANGVYVIPTTVTSAIRAYTFSTSGATTVYGGLYGAVAATTNTINVSTLSIAGHESYLTLIADSPSSFKTQIILDAGLGASNLTLEKTAAGVGTAYLAASTINLAASASLTLGGDLVRGSSTGGGIYYAKATPSTHASYAGATVAVGAWAAVNLSSFSPAIPTGARGVYVRAVAAFSAIATANWFGVAGTSTGTTPAVVCRGQVASQVIDGTGIVPVDRSGTPCIYVKANGAVSATSVTLEVYGYFE